MCLMIAARAVLFKSPAKTLIIALRRPALAEAAGVVEESAGGP
jgi:hypothetical protein